MTLDTLIYIRKTLRDTVADAKAEQALLHREFVAADEAGADNAPELERCCEAAGKALSEACAALRDFEAQEWRC